MFFLTIFRSKILVTAVFSTVVAGCSSIQFIAQSAKNIENNVAADTNHNYGDYGPRYKVGNTYSIKGRSYTPAEDYDYVETGDASWYGPNFHGKLTANGGRFDMHKISAAHRTLPLPSVAVVTNLENGRQLKLIINDRGPYAHNRIIDLSKRSAELLGIRVQGVARVRVQILAEESKALKTYMQTNGKQGRLPSNALGSHYTNLTDRAKRPENNRIITAAPIGQVSVIQKSSNGSLLKPNVSRETPKQDVQLTSQSPAPIMESLPDMPMVKGAFVQAGVFSNQKNAVATVKLLKQYGIVRMDVSKADDGKRLYRVRVGPIQSPKLTPQILQGIKGLGFPDAVVIFINQ